MLNKHAIAALMLLLLVTGCGSPSAFHTQNASGHYSSDIVQCAIYAREQTGVGLYGDADSWWQQSRNMYIHGNVPQAGAVLVLRKTSRMRGGHVAVVKDVVNSRLIDVTHSNWGSDSHSRHIIYDSMRVQDVSPEGNWTSVKFWNYEKNVFGFPYAAYGFIYP